MTSWTALQDEISSCTACRGRFPCVTVQCPPGHLYNSPPPVVTVLFVGVAPPVRGSHFHTDPRDKLRGGLFRVLTKLGYPCSSLADFASYGFYLVHTAKCAYDESRAANLNLSRACAPLHLRREIEILAPHAVCFLSMAVGPTVADDLARSWGNENVPDAETTALLKVGQRRAYVLVSPQPLRASVERAERCLRLLFAHLGDVRQYV